MKTDNPEHVGKHAYEIAGLGQAPFRFVGMSVNSITYPDGTSKAGGTCAYCGTGIANECHVLSADGRRFKVGSDCIAKVDDAGLLKAFKSSPDYRAHQRKLREAKAKRVSAELTAFLAQHKARFESLPHPRGFRNFDTGVPLTRWDAINYSLRYCGAAGRAALLKVLKKEVAGAQ